MPQALNPRQKEILDYLREHNLRHAYPPTVREIGQAVGLSSSSTVQNHLNALETKGYIKRDPTKSRTLEIVGEQSPSSKILQIPLIGRVAAGTPLLAEQNIEDHIAIGKEFLGTEDAFALSVRGDSMIDAGIYDGDTVIVKPRKDAPNGTIVVARIENPLTGEHEATVKRFYRESGRVRLQPENAAMQPIYQREVEIEGVVIAVIRRLG